jgi:hypothetical protein
VAKAAPVMFEVYILMNDMVEPIIVEGKNKTLVMIELPSKVEYIVLLTVVFNTVILESSVVCC